MNRLKCCILFLASIFVATVTTPCFCFAAEDVFKPEKSPVKEVFRNSLYGGLAGTLVGAATMVFTRHPGDHLDRMAIGAAAGALMGAGYGVFKATRSLVEVEEGKVKFAMPTIMPEIKETNSKGQKPVVVMAEFLRGSF